MDPPPAYDADDDDYDLYLYIPSISSRLIPVEGSPEITLELENLGTAAHQSSETILPPYKSSSSDVGTQTVQVDEFEVESSRLRVRSFFDFVFAARQLTVLQPSSPTLSDLSDFIFVDRAEDVLNAVGYSSLLRAGLAFKVCLAHSVPLR